MITLGTNGGFAVGTKSYPRTLQLGDREVVLTFDDGPLPGPTERVLDTLERECVRATFFFIGRNAAAHPALVRRAFTQGHTIASHSFSHPVRTLRGISEQAAIDEIVRGSAAVRTAAGIADEPSGTMLRFFRFPGFADTPTLNNWLAKNDIAIFGTDVWASDWTRMSSETMVALVMKRLEEARRGIVLFHDTQPTTATMLSTLLAALKSKGFRVVHVVPGNGPTPVLQAAPAGWASETEDILARIMPRLLRGNRQQAK